MAEKESMGDGLGISGFTLGVLSIIFAGWTGVLVSVIGGAFCYAQQKKKKVRIGKVGLILNIIGLGLSIIFIWLASTVLAPLLEELA